jgi:CRP-like cAMP-binding protein
MEKESCAGILRQDEHLAKLESEDLEDLVEVLESRTLVSGEPIWSVGDAGDAAYVLGAGRVELTIRAQPDGKRTRQHGTPGTMLGLAHLAGEWEHESTAYPLERTEVLRLARSDFRVLLEQHHPAAFRIVDAVAVRLVEEVRDANRRMQEVSGHPAETLRTLRRRARKSERR